MTTTTPHPPPVRKRPFPRPLLDLGALLLGRARATTLKWFSKKKPQKPMSSEPVPTPHLVGIWYHPTSVHFPVGNTSLWRADSLRTPPNPSSTSDPNPRNVQNFHDTGTATAHASLDDTGTGTPHDSIVHWYDAYYIVDTPSRVGRTRERAPFVVNDDRLWNPRVHSFEYFECDSGSDRSEDAESSEDESESECKPEYEFESESEESVEVEVDVEGPTAGRTQGMWKRDFNSVPDGADWVCRGE